MASARAQAYHNLAVMLEAGVPAVKALRTAVSAGRSPTARGFAAMAGGVAEGQDLSEAMSADGSFPPLDVVLVRVGERAGNLPECFRSLSQWYEFQDRLRRTVTSGLALPLLVLHVAALVAPLPALFLEKVGVAGYVRQVVATLAFLYVPAGAVLAVVRWTPRSGPLRRLADGLVLGVPLLGGAVRDLALSRFCRAFAALHRAGVLMAESVDLAAGVVGNVVMAARLGRAAEAAGGGAPAWEGFDRRLPREFRESWRVGEESGALDEVAARLERTAGESARRRLETLSTWLPRILYLGVCLLLAVRIVSAYTMMLR